MQQRQIRNMSVFYHSTSLRIVLGCVLPVWSVCYLVALLFLFVCLFFLLLFSIFFVFSFLFASHGFFLLSSVLFKFFFFRFEFCFPVFKFLILFLVLLIQSQLLEVAAKPAKIKLPDRAQSFVFVVKL